MAGGLIGALRATLGLNTADFEAGARRASARSRTMAAEIRASFDGVKEAGRLLGVALGAELFVEQAKRSLEFAASLGETSQRIGVTVEQLQALQRQAAATGTSQEGLERALAIFNRTLGQAQAGLPDAVRTFRALGISREQLMSFQNGGQALSLIFDRLNRIRTPAEQAAAAQRLFGRGAAELIPIIREGSAGLEEWIQRARDSGEITEEQARQAHEAENELRQLGITIRTDLAGAMIEFLPVARQVVAMLEAIGSAARMALGAMASIGNATIGPNATRGIGSAALSPGGAVLLPITIARDIARRIISATPGRGHNSYPLQGGPSGGFTGFHNGPGQAGGTDLDLSPAGHHNSSDAAEKRRLRDQHQFEEDLRREQIQQLEEAKNQTNDYVEQSSIQRQIMALNRDQYKSDLDLKVALKDMTAAQEAQLLQAYDQSDEARRITLGMSVHADWVREQATIAQNEYELARQQLQGQYDGARTEDERRRIGLQLLDLDYQYRRLKLQNIVRETNVYNEAERLDAQHQLDALGASYGVDRAAVLRGTMGPLERFLDELPTTAAKANEALQAVAADGLSSITDGLADAILMTRSWGDVFKNVAKQILADLLKISIQRAIIGPLTNALSGLIPGAGGAAPFLPLTAGSPGNNASWFIGGGIPGRARGGPVVAGHPYVVGEHQAELFVPGASGTILPDVNMGRGGGNGPITIHQTYTFEGVAITQQEFTQGLLAAKYDTMGAIAQLRRRAP